MSNSITSQSGFIGQIKKFGLKKIVLSWDFLVTCLLFILLILNEVLDWRRLSALDNENLMFIVTVASAIFSVLITALAIILSFSSSNFVKFLRSKDMFDRIIFIFWWTSIAFLTVLTLSFIKYLVNFNTEWIRIVGSAAVLTIFAYGLIQTYYVVGALMRFAYFLGHFESKE